MRAAAAVAVRSRPETVRGDGLRGELPVEFRFLFDQPRPQRDRLALHGFKQASYCGDLLRPQFQLFRQFQHMRWTRISVQFRGQRHSHAAPLAEVGDLLLRKRLDGSVLHSGVRAFGKYAARYKQKDGCRQNALHWKLRGEMPLLSQKPAELETLRTTAGRQMIVPL